MATVTTLLAETTLTPSHVTVDPAAAGEAAGVGNVRKSLVNPGLSVFTNCKVDELLEAVVTHIEDHLSRAETVLSPSEMPSGIKDSHTRQIEVCLARFKAAKVPTVSIRDYLLRLHMHCPFSTVKLLALVHYLMVLDVLYLEISKVLRRNTAHRLILASIVMASKVLDDRLMPQIRWSVVGGVSLHQLHGLELAFFFLMNGKCWITEESLIAAGKYLTGRSDDADRLVLPILHTEAADVIWSSVGNRSGAKSVEQDKTQDECSKGVAM